MSDVGQKVRDFIDVHQDSEDWYDTEIEVGELRVICHSWLELLRERDEARAAYRSLIMEETSAERRGYRRGVEDAAKVGAEAASYGIWEHDMDRVERAILALLEQTEPGEKK